MIKIFYCLYCNKEVLKKYSTTNTYCNSECASAHATEKDFERVERGEITANSTNLVKRYLIKTRGNKCEECSLPPNWNNKPLTLELDHKDGDSENMSTSNVRLLCPNCHTQTPNYGNKNRRGEGKRKLYYENNRGKEYYN